MSEPTTFESKVATLFTTDTNLILAPAGLLLVGTLFIQAQAFVNTVSVLFFALGSIATGVVYQQYQSSNATSITQFLTYIATNLSESGIVSIIFFGIVLLGTISPWNAVDIQFSTFALFGVVLVLAEATTQEN